MLFIEVDKKARTDGLVRLVDVFKIFHRASKRLFNEDMEVIIGLLNAMSVEYKLKKFGSLHRFTLQGVTDVEQATQWAANKQYSIDPLTKDCAHCLLQHIRTKPQKSGSKKND